MKGQDVMTSNVTCHAMLWTENNNIEKTQGPQKHINPTKLAGLTGSRAEKSSKCHNTRFCLLSPA